MAVKVNDWRAGRSSFMMMAWSLTLLLNGFPIGAYESQAQKSPAVTLRSELVTFAVTVLDRQERTVAGLTAHDFELYDNERHRPVAFFLNESVGQEISRPISLVLAIDSSRSIAATISQQRSAARSLISSLGGGTSISIIEFSATPHEIIELTGDKQRALEAFSRLGGLGGPTAILDSILFGLGQLAKKADPNSQKLVLVLSDGLDTASRAEPESCIQLADEIGASVYGVQIPIFAPSEGRLMPRPPSRGWLRVLDATGGKLWRVGNAREAIDPRSKIDLTSIFLDLVHELQNQYVLGFYPDEQSLSGYHALKVRVKRPGVRKVRHRLGYFMEPPK